MQNVLEAVLNDHLFDPGDNPWNKGGVSNNNG